MRRRKLSGCLCIVIQLQAFQASLRCSPVSWQPAAVSSKSPIHIPMTGNLHRERAHGIQESADRNLDNVATLTVNRPRSMNALNSEVLGELECALYELDLDDGVKAVVLTGAGERAFVAGADIKEMAEMNAFQGQPLPGRGSR